MPLALNGEADVGIAAKPKPAAKVSAARMLFMGVFPLKSVVEKHATLVRHAPRCFVLGQSMRDGRIGSGTAPCSWMAWRLTRVRNFQRRNPYGAGTGRPVSARQKSSIRVKPNGALGETNCDAKCLGCGTSIERRLPCSGLQSFPEWRLWLALSLPSNRQTWTEPYVRERAEVIIERPAPLVRERVIERHYYEAAPERYYAPRVYAPGPYYYEPGPYAHGYTYVDRPHWRHRAFFAHRPSWRHRHWRH